MNEAHLADALIGNICWVVSQVGWKSDEWAYSLKRGSSALTPHRIRRSHYSRESLPSCKCNFLLVPPILASVAPSI